MSNNIFASSVYITITFEMCQTFLDDPVFPTANKVNSKLHRRTILIHKLTITSVWYAVQYKRWTFYLIDKKRTLRADIGNTNMKNANPFCEATIVWNKICDISNFKMVTE